MQRQQLIIDRLQAALPLVHLEVINESNQHGVPPGSETHFKLVLVSPAFAGVRAVARHQKVYGLLSDEMPKGLHALALHTYTPEEWEASGVVPSCPNCLGGSKHG